MQTIKQALSGFDYVESYRVLVMPRHLNAANRLFGGQLMSWFDEAAALYVMCVAKTSHIVTLKVSELLFKEPILQGDFLIFRTCLIAKGKSSLTVRVEAIKKHLTDSSQNKLACHCEMVFVVVDPATGKSVAHQV